MKRAIVIAGVLMALPACASKSALEPEPGQTLPPAPFGSETRPDSETLLDLPTLAAPERSVELRRRSEEREDDPFDLPPE